MNWKITQIKKFNSPLEGTVVNASYSVSDEVSTIASDVNLLLVNADSFTELSDLTEGKVIQWVKDALNANDIEGDIGGAEKIEALVSLKTNTPPPQIMPLPWEL
jgi:hypothetical protein